ncbi:MAG: cell division protein FtsZ [Patescibacteria group bacterium]|nr:cell division protein FtsZ [Patescibacteria group bacterium]MDD3778162.1 cell division protein FtsZ [Patescibacteria group bacterium]MDD3939545.1 cell division protein FtsZ [Patescibacteria group bacterium]MDD4443715.1 cell division protein FtsZ [Patescibacteria group bacterium]NCU39426.1 cell division protein FtsZ [Candidatus Falkowbacteria bacterium]
MAEVKPEIETFAKIKVVGVGGGGNSAINRMIDSGVKGVGFVAVNTDIQALHHNKAGEKIHIGKTVTRGLGAGMNPDLGKAAAEESENEIKEVLKDCDMVFVTCGMGGGTGTGASPIVAQIAKDLGALTVAVVTKPFMFEGGQRKNVADRGHAELADKVDAIITISNDKLLQVIDKKTSLLESFKIADDVLRQGVQGIAEIITVPGVINADFADVKTVMSNAGSALMGIGTATGENKAIEAAKQAINSNLLDMSIDGARGIVFTVTGGPELSMSEVNEAAKIITAAADEEAKIIFGAVIDEKLKDQIKITVVATGFDGHGQGKKQEAVRTNYTPNTFIVEKDNKADLASTSEDKNKTKFSSVFKNLPIKPTPETKKPSIKAESNLEDEEDDLTIPTFLRKKMG